MRPYKRSDRLSQEIQRIIAEAIRFKTRDPRLKDVTVLRVELSNDLKLARIYFSAFDHEEEALKGLEHAKGYLRTILAKELRIKFTPDIEFKIEEKPPQAFLELEEE